MPFRPEHSLLRVEVPALHTIDTSSAENLFGMVCHCRAPTAYRAQTDRSQWSLFSKTSHAMEDGKRLENLSWRLWNRETFCCKPQYHQTSSRAARLRKQPSAGTTRSAPAASATASMARSATAADIPVPDLSSSLDSASSGDMDDEAGGESSVSSSMSEDSDEQESHTRIPRARPELGHHLTNDQGRPYEKHITPVDLEKIVISIKESQSIEPIDMTLPTLKVGTEEAEAYDATASTTTTPCHHAPLLESSASTVATHNSAKSSESVESQDSSSTEMSSHSIIRGFVPGGAPSSYRSQTNLSAAAAQPTPILKTLAQLHSQPPMKKKGAMFTIGTSSGEDESSLDSHMRMPSMPKSELSESLKRGGILKKTTSFKDEVATIARAVARHSPVFESDDEDEEVSESAIEDDDDSSEWEDSDEGNGSPSSMDGTLFQRVDSRRNLTSRRSLLTTLMHEPDRAKALANAASRSTPAMRRSRVTSPTGPSLATTPESTAGMQMAAPQQAGTKPQPIIITTSNTHQQLALSPRTTRRNMLSTELTESLRKNLLWERQHKSTGNLAALRRRHTSQDVRTLREHPQPIYPLNTGTTGTNSTTMSFNNEYFNAEIGEYHTRGW